MSDGLIARGIKESWDRSIVAGVSRGLASAPLVMNEDGLALARERSDWLELAESVLAPQLELVQGAGHVLTLFDPQGRMLASAGDPFVLEELDDIHFIPGADWSEAAAGTNGPGTALAIRRPVHVIGRDHYCEAWHPWHCAAVPLHDPAGELLGALDISGPSQRADGRMLQLARTLGLTIEQALQARQWKRRAAVLARFSELTARYPGEPIIAVDAEGLVFQATGTAQARGVPARLKLPRGALGLGAPPPNATWLDGASVFPVHDEGQRAGACVVGRQSVRQRRPRAMEGTRYTFADLVGEGLSPVVSLARSAAATSMPVLILGESGVGKELLAQAIHSASPRVSGPFVAVNCAALSRELVESELFGYVGGAFTGARPEGAIGRIEAANQGTLFLDEVGDLPLPAQATLLRMLQEQCVTPVGSVDCRSVDVRIVAATNHRLDDAVKAGRFRLDLLHRLNVITLEVPPLRQRLADLDALITHASARISRETGLSIEVPQPVRAALATHDWPGNVRELENVLRRLAVVGKDRPVTIADLPFTTAQPKSAPTGQVQQLLEVIHSAKNMADAAARLGINRSTLYRQLERLGLKPGRTAVSDEP